MSRLFQSIRLFLVLVGLVITWPINPILAILRVKTPIRKFLIRQLPASELYY